MANFRDEGPSRTWRSFFKPEITLGAVVIALVTLFSVSGILYSGWVQDRVTNTIIVTKLDEIQKEQAAVRLALPLSAKDIEQQQVRIASLEANFNAVREKLSQAQQDVAILKDNLNAISNEVHDILNASRQTVRQPR